MGVICVNSVLSFVSNSKSAGWWKRYIVVFRLFFPLMGINKTQFQDPACCLVAGLSHQYDCFLSELPFAGPLNVAISDLVILFSLLPSHWL